MDAVRFVFLDETRLTTKMTRLYGRSRRGERLGWSGAAWALADDHLHRRIATERHHRAFGARRSD